MINPFKVLKDAGMIGQDATKFKYVSKIVEDTIDRLIKGKRLVFVGDKVVYTNRQNITQEYTFKDFGELMLDIIKAARECGIPSDMIVDMLKVREKKGV